MNILIIGSKGFIGKHCVTHFSKLHNVWQCDVATDYTTEKYLLVEATNSDYSDIFQSQQFDVCINCSGASSVPDSIVKPQRDFILNTVNVFKQLDAIRRFNPYCKYINLSSAAVYGNPVTLPIHESQALNPISPYGQHKKIAEDLCKSFYENYGLKTCSLRVFSAYGQGLRKQLFWDLAHKTTKNQTVYLYGSGKESRDFIHVLDLMNAIECVINKGHFKKEIINIANGRECFINDAAEIFYKYYNDKIKVYFDGQKRVGDPVNWVADINVLKTYGYRQKISLIEGLEQYTAWLRESK